VKHYGWKYYWQSLGLTSSTQYNYCDNKAAINIAHNPIQHDRTKHVEIDSHFIKEKLREGIIYTPYVKTREQLVDMLTNGVSSGTLHSALSKLGMWDIYASAWGGVLKITNLSILDPDFILWFILIVLAIFFPY